jgi:16S rRNA (uracil1498-N3)-methyltransferase
MKIAKPQTWSEWILPVESSNNKSGERRLLAHPRGIPLSQVDLSLLLSTQLAIGPEGGFAETEIELASRNGWQLVDLGPRILRVETAAVALSAAVALLNPPLAPP